MQSYKLYTVEIKKNVSNLVTVPFRNAVDLPFPLRSVPLRSVSGAFRGRSRQPFASSSCVGAMCTLDSLFHDDRTLFGYR